ncbi:MAG: hypothetical protein IJK78_02765 [Bacteroidales bacterium]|nr:hypothetical protein [Bacteroidales bacterium]
MKKGLSIVINIILFAIIVLLAWQVVKSIQAPIKFNTEQKAREAKVIERLLDIRNAEVLYKNATNKYTDNFDTLINFCQTAEIPVVQMISKQNLEDSTYYTVYDTIGFVKVMDSLKSKRENFNINELKVVPFSQPQTYFELEAGTKETSGIKVPLFEARTPYEVYLGQPGAAFNEKEWKQRVDNLKAEKESINRYAGLKVGSMEEASTEGNWEKL